MFGSIEALKTVSDLFMPISGKVLEINKRLLKEPTLVNSDPYNDGWILKIEITAATEMDNLLNAVSYNQLIGN